MQTETIQYNFENYTRTELEGLLEAGEAINNAYRVLHKGGLHLISECMKGEEGFYDYSHYPDDDVFDDDSKSQYYFHTHRGIDGEYGHFHTYLRADGIPKDVVAIENTGEEPWPSEDDAFAHLICISMNRKGYPIGLFTTNRWVTNENWYQAEDVILMLEHFSIDHAFPNLAVNYWINGMIRLYKAEIAELIRQRDVTIKHWRSENPDTDVFEDRGLELASQMNIDVVSKIENIKLALSR